jgi:hypothetical protein
VSLGKRVELRVGVMLTIIFFEAAIGSGMAPARRYFRELHGSTTTSVIASTSLSLIFDRREIASRGGLSDAGLMRSTPSLQKD